MKDYEDWIGELVNEMQQTNALGKVHKIHVAVKSMEAKPQAPPVNLTKGKDGNMLNNATQVAAVWYDFLASKFVVTKAEEVRPEMQTLPDTRGVFGDILTRDEIEAGICKMKNGKANGPDGIPVELYKHSKVCREIICAIIGKIWVT